MSHVLIQSITKEKNIVKYETPIHVSILGWGAILAVARNRFLEWRSEKHRTLNVRNSSKEKKSFECGSWQWLAREPVCLSTLPPRICAREWNYYYNESFRMPFCSNVLKFKKIMCKYFKTCILKIMMEMLHKTLQYHPPFINRYTFNIIPLTCGV